MNKLVRFDPFAELDALQNRFFGDDWLTPSRMISAPTTDVYTKDGAMTIEVHLPNFADDDIKIEVDGNDLIMRAEKHEREEDKGKRYIVRESSSSFYRRIQLPERANIDKIDADIEGGVLTVKIPLTPVPEPKRIAVKKSKSKKRLS
ncbi:MAG: Hsp20/alpha crystallin family protein [Candidatus Nanosyncoccaceae bacterium]